MTPDHDVIVLGVGGMGSAAASHLARRGTDVLGIERFDVPHAKGSSHGVTRIIRVPQFKHPDYVPLAQRSLDLWTDLEAEHDRQLFYRTGSLDFGPPDSDVFTGSKESCAVHDLEHTVLTGRELTERPGGLDLPDEYRAVYQPDGGFAHAEQSVVAHVQAAQKRGATIRARERVHEWTADESGVCVVTDRGTYTAETLVTTVGAWTGELFPTLDPILAPERQVLGWFQPTAPERFTPERFPVFVADVPEGNYYGFPAFEVPGFKLGKHHHCGETGAVEELRREPTRDDEAVLRRFADEYVPAGTGPTMRLVDCLYTNTPDRDFLLDRHPDHDNVVVGAGFSGHGFKFAPVVGEILADLAMEGTTEHPIDRFAIPRFDR
ncbi:N-methyl-L-tryptophan oxidase [Haloplanus natans]|uniref:N-methyl-L-tryptophan oxidase n=1 Tax=Haloplanus natans TaxID=376171 RepID=UPI0006777014|nr:N-methyl-L-tryptophan oxidase [Haloplanus natans]